MASHLAGIGQASGTGVGLVHALGHASGPAAGCRTDGARGGHARGPAFYAAEPGLRDRELAPGRGRPRGRVAGRRRRRRRAAAIDAVARVLAAVGQRPTLGSLGFDDAALDIVAQDAIDDAAIAQLAAAAVARGGSCDPRVGRRLTGQSEVAVMRQGSSGL